jgi:hypothetical protein
VLLQVKRYLGMRPPDAVRWALARKYPELEEAFARAYAGLAKLRIVSESGGLDPGTASELFAKFFNDPRIQNDIHGDDKENWVHLGANRWEHAHWINGAMAVGLFNLVPNFTSFVSHHCCPN